MMAQLKLGRLFAKILETELFFYFTPLHAPSKSLAFLLLFFAPLLGFT